MSLLFSDEKLTKNFTVDEYLVGQRGNGKINKRALIHANMLQELREYLDEPIYVTSWYRSEEYNKACGGIPTSNHLKGTATDIYVKDLDFRKFLKIARKWKSICERYLIVGEIGFYPDDGFIHVGSYITYSKKFYNWRTKNGVQKNGYYNRLLK